MELNFYENFKIHNIRFLLFYLSPAALGTYYGPATTAYPYYGPQTTEVDWTNWGVTQGSNDFAEYGNDWWNSLENQNKLKNQNRQNQATTQFAEIFATTQATNWKRPVQPITTFDMFGTTPSPNGQVKKLRGMDEKYRKCLKKSGSKSTISKN